ncbi:uncharacterized protein FTJAE_9381 [Fusarium tjaetaba]|uniref:Thioesterase domain-containing protein n=1 Tax=Fusarium tjaetaba TaxID=1567544 RepID=A0A8H5R3A1_9HYPO|nr:uncharacterized protein FTJAE_9381 [Fusarium tjaetaba]KAF5627296.1 hypothetical protein FTJAE_9381 [Fusarium tjaetaba]
MATQEQSTATSGFQTIQDLSQHLASIAASHPATVELQQKIGVEVTRSVLTVREECIQNNPTSTTLAGLDAISPSPFVYKDDTAGHVLAFYHLGHKLSGHSGLVHGGIAAVLLDECMGRASFPRLTGKISVTANLNLNYKSPIKVDSMILIRAEVTAVQGRKAWVRGVIENTEDGAVFVEATGLFIEPKWAASLGKLL